MGRRFGQHFLTQRSILEKIANACAPSGHEGRLIEIGPGRGALTEFLLDRCSNLVAIEIDPVLVEYLRTKFRAQAKLELIENDVLKLDLAVWGRVTVAGNLPYYITSPILTKVLGLGSHLQKGVFLVQREVAHRIAAEPESRDYGFLSVQTQVLGRPRILFHVAPGAFSPPPKVESSVFEVVPHPQPLVPDIQPFLEFAGECFRQKRKTLRNNLLPRYGSAITADPDAGKRAEQLSVSQLIALYRRLAPAG